MSEGVRGKRADRVWSGRRFPFAIYSGKWARRVRKVENLVAIGWGRRDALVEN